VETRTEIFEILVNNIGSTEFALGNQPNLRTAKKIKSIEAFKVDQVTVAPSGKNVINATVFAKSFLRLIGSRNNDLRYVPMLSLSKTVNGTQVPEFNIDAAQGDEGAIDPEKSKIVVGSTAGLVLNEVFLLAVTYEK
jgi:hypothetical protein